MYLNIGTYPHKRTEGVATALYLVLSEKESTRSSDAQHAARDEFLCGLPQVPDVAGTHIEPAVDHLLVKRQNNTS